MTNFVVKYTHYIILILSMACTPTSQEENPPQAQVQQEHFGITESGDSVTLYTLSNAQGMKVAIMDYGGIITSIHVPDREGNMGNVVLGFDNLTQYEGRHPFFGALVGRYANRIGGAQFTLDDSTYTLAANNGPNSLHGGLKGFDKQMWESKPFQAEKEVGVVLEYVSTDGEEGYPGTLTTVVTYTLTDDNELTIKYKATTDKRTILNLTNHSYFNLTDGGATDILGHELILDADLFTPVDSNMIPTGELRPVEGTPFDFRSAKAIGQDIDMEGNQQIAYGGGYDHNYVINREGEGLVKFAEVYDPVSGRQMEVSTTLPGVQLYCGNFLDGSLTGPGGKTYNKRSGLCLETQHYPDSPNKPEFPSVVLSPGETYSHTTAFAFSVR